MPDPLQAEFVDDESSIGKQRATTAKQRRAALIKCLDDFWPDRDIDTLERIDDRRADPPWHGWAMWERS